MAKSGAYIRDVQLLEKLNDRIVSSGEAMANIDQNVSSYINGVQETLQSQLDSIQERLRDAETRLMEAENVCAACHASQVCDETGMLVPCCEWEESSVETARMEVEKWRMRYEQGQQILGECRQEIADYSSGGHVLVMNMREQQTPKASQILNGCINKLQDVLNSDMVPNVNLVLDSFSQGTSSSPSTEGFVNSFNDFYNP